MNLTPASAEILLVEDNPADVLLTQEVFKSWKILNRLHVVTNGVEALDFLKGVGKYGSAVRPDIILLDLNLPLKDGREVLSEIKKDLDLRAIPVVVLTTSESEEDVLQSYNLHANCYITKPLEIKNFVKVVNVLEDFWFAIVKLPPRPAQHP